MNFGIDVVKLLEYAAKSLRVPVWLVLLFVLALGSSGINLWMVFSRQNCVAGQHSSFVYPKLNHMSLVASGTKNKLGLNSQTVFVGGLPTHSVFVKENNFAGFTNLQNRLGFKFYRLVMQPNTTDKNNPTRKIQQFGISVNVDQNKVWLSRDIKTFGSGIADLTCQVSVPSGYAHQDQGESRICQSNPFAGGHASSVSATRLEQKLNSRGSGPQEGM